LYSNQTNNGRHHDLSLSLSPPLSLNNNLEGLRFVETEKMKSSQSFFDGTIFFDGTTLLKKISQIDFTYFTEVRNTPIWQNHNCPG
jgi:hypothetical protein